MTKTYLLLVFLLPLFLAGQSRKIKGTLYINDSTCQGQGKPYKTKLKRCKNTAVLLSSDLYMSFKYINNTNRRGVFRIKLSKEELEYYKFLVFVGDSIQTSFISIDAAKRRFSQKIEPERSRPDYYSVGKPAIYLYPKEKTQVNVQLDFKGKLGTTFPAYKEGWNVLANPNGDLLNLSDNRKYNYLFWEGTYAFPEKHFNYNNGFVVKKEDLTQFLLSKLAHIGLNDTEINDFIIYWLPQLEKNKTNFIHFWINDNIDSSAFLNVTPKPDSEIVLFMEFKSVHSSFKCEAQILPHLQRKDFTLIEWGGTNLATKKVE